MSDVNSSDAGIAIVEDDMGLIDLLELILKSRDFTVCFTAYDGYDAVNKFKNSNPKPPVVIMDYRLQSMDGIQTTKEFIKIEPRTRIIFLSAAINMEKDAMDAGAFMFLHKPASMYDIIDAIKKACKRRFFT